MIFDAWLIDASAEKGIQFFAISYLVLSKQRFLKIPMIKE